MPMRNPSDGSRASKTKSDLDVGEPTSPSAPTTPDPRARSGLNLDWLVGTELAGYRFKAKLGQGGMGCVFLARHLKLSRDVAIKVLLPELTGRELVARGPDRVLHFSFSMDDGQTHDLIGFVREDGPPGVCRLRLSAERFARLYGTG